VGIGPPGLSGYIYCGLAAVRRFVERMVAVRSGRNPAPPMSDMTALNLFY